MSKTLRKLALAAFLALLAPFALAISPAAAASAQIQGIVVADCSAPPNTYTAGSIVYVNVDTHGNVCTSATATISGAVTVAGVSTAANQTATQAVAGSDATKADAVQGITGGKPLTVHVDNTSSNPTSVTVNTPPNDLTTGPTACTSTATCTALTIATSGAGSAGVQITGSGAGMAWTFQGSIDATNYFTIACYSPGNATAAAVTTGSANGAWYCPAAGYKYVRLNWTGLTSGTVTETLNSSAGSAQPPSTTTISGKNGSTQTTLAVDVNGDVVVVGAAANNASASGNPVAVSANATSAEATNATNGQNSQLVTDLAHKLLVLPYANPENFVSGVTGAMTGTTSTSLIAAPASGLRNYITQLTCSNSHATVGTFVNVQDGSGGTTIYTVPAAAVYGGAAITFPAPLRQPTTATAIYVADVTTGANVICAASGYKGS